MVTILMLLLGAALTAGTFISVSAEFSLVAVDQAVLDKKTEEEDRGVASVLRAAHTLSTQLSGTQVGITLTTILLGYTTQGVLVDLLEDLLGSAGFAQGLATSIAAFVATAFANIFSVLFGELVPENPALAYPLMTTMHVASPQTTFTAIARPVIWVLGRTANWVLTRMNIEPQEETPSAHSASELAALVEHSVEEDTFDMSTVDLFVNTVRMSIPSVVNVMTDRGRLYILSESNSAQGVLDLARETRHSRFPATSNDSDDILGLVSLRRAVAVPADRRAEIPATSSPLMTDASLVPEATPIGPLMAQLRDEGLQMTVVTDGYGSVSGIVTLKDAVEEVVGEVSDEHDQHRLGIRPRPDGTFSVPGTLRPDELVRHTDINLPEDGPYDTTGDLVMNKLGEILVVGSRMDVDGIGIEVAQVQGRRVAQVATTPAPEAESEEVSL